MFVYGLTLFYDKATFMYKKTQNSVPITAQCLF